MVGKGVRLSGWSFIGGKLYFDKRQYVQFRLRMSDFNAPEQNPCIFSHSAMCLDLKFKKMKLPATLQHCFLDSDSTSIVCKKHPVGLQKGAKRISNQDARFRSLLRLFPIYTLHTILPLNVESFGIIFYIFS